MKNRQINNRIGGLLATLLLTGVLLGGCSPSGTETKMSEAEKANFKGGPMPADYKDPTMPGNAPPAAKK